jgi:hypothetical protein
MKKAVFWDNVVNTTSTWCHIPEDCFFHSNVNVSDKECITVLQSTQKHTLIKFFKKWNGEENIKKYNNNLHVYRRGRIITVVLTTRNLRKSYLLIDIYNLGHITDYKNNLSTNIPEQIPLPKSASPKIPSTIKSRVTSMQDEPKLSSRQEFNLSGLQTVSYLPYAASVA